ncbi:MAG: hypothetical protein ACLURV_03100 [Gallintestinimicrobium sp.]
MIRILQSVSNMDRGGIETMLMNYYGIWIGISSSLILVNKEKPGFLMMRCVLWAVVFLWDRD